VLFFSENAYGDNINVLIMLNVVFLYYLTVCTGGCSGRSLTWLNKVCLERFYSINQCYIKQLGISLLKQNLLILNLILKKYFIVYLIKEIFGTYWK
jgi:hypothetical protein